MRWLGCICQFSYPLESMLIATTMPYAYMHREHRIRPFMKTRYMRLIHVFERDYERTTDWTLARFPQAPTTCRLRCLFFCHDLVAEEAISPPGFAVALDDEEFVD